MEADVLIGVTEALLEGEEEVGGWVGEEGGVPSGFGGGGGARWVGGCGRVGCVGERKGEENEALRMSWCELGVWVDGWEEGELLVE